jgi:hypothetical protein
MTKMEKIKLADDLIKENGSCTIRDYLDTVAEVESINPSAVIPMRAARLVKHKAPVIIQMTEVRPVIRSVAVAKRIGFASALRTGAVYGRERDRWAFRGGAESMMLQAAFRNAYKTGKQILRTVINEKL